jgi:23S rRNA (adenine2503-C2)-methyltransferase
MESLFGMSAEELRGVMEGMGLAKYRAAQLGDALYKARVERLEEITTLPVEVRERLAAEGYRAGLPEIVQTAKSVWIADFSGSAINWQKVRGQRKWNRW